MNRRLVAVLVAGLWAMPAWAQTPAADPEARPPLMTAPQEGPPPPPETRLWDGNHTSVMVGGAVNWVDHAPAMVEQQGIGFRIAGRLGVISQFVDTEIAFERVSHGGQNGAGLTRNELGFQVGTHPGFPLTVFNDWWYDVFAGIHGYAGASLMRVTMTGGPPLLLAHVAGETEHSEWQPNIYVGAGADFPISPRDKAWGLWLTARYNLRWSWFGPKQPELSLSDSQAVISLSFRLNTTSWARIPKPF